MLAKALSLALLSALSANAYAQSTAAIEAPSNTSVAETKPAEAKPFKLPLTLGYTGIFFGPELIDPSADWTPAAAMGNFSDSRTQDALVVRHTLSVGKNFNNGLALSANLYFDTAMTDPAGNGKTRGFFWLDSYLKLAKTGLVDTKLGSSSFRLDTQVRAYLPTSLRSRQANTYGSYRFYLNPNITFGNSIFSLTTSNYAMVYAQPQMTNPVDGSTLRQLEFFAGPQLNAQIHPRVNLFFLYEAVVHMDMLGKWDNSQTGLALTDIEPGADIQVTDNITISPFLNWFPALPISTTSLNVSVSASL